jgi:PAS domain S-box-containing protein
MPTSIRSPAASVPQEVPTPSRGTTRARYVLALAAVAGAWLAQTALRGLLPAPALLLLFVLAVALAARSGGLRAGVLATLLGGAAFCATALLSPVPPHAGQLGIELALFVVVAGLVSSMGERQRRIAGELVRSTARLGDVLRASRMVAWEWQLPGGAGQILGDTSLWGVPGTPRTRDEAWACIHPDDRARVHTLVEDAIARADSYVLRYRVVQPDGGIRWLEAHGSASKATSGEPVKLYGVTLDITERVQAEQHYNRTSAILSAFIRSTPSVMVVKDRDSRVLMANPHLLRVLGRSEAEVLGRNSVDFFGPERGAVLLANDRRVMETGAPETFEELIPLPDGMHVYLSTKAPLYDETGEVIGVTGLGVDITARKQIEEALRRATDTMSASVCLCGRDFTYRWVSRAFASAWNEPAARFVGRSIEEVLGSAAWTRLRPLYERVLTGEQLEDEHLVPLGALGPRWVHVTYTPTRSEGGEVDGWVAVVIDIDQRKRSEEALKEAARRKDEFLATLAHELRNPLAPLRNGLELMRLTSDPTLVAQARDMMERQLAHMIRLVDDLLDLSRITRGKVELRLARCELQTIVRNAVDTSRPLMEARGHRLQVQLPAEPVELIADAVRLSQVLANLLNNSARYCDPGGHIALIAESDGARLTVRVEDTGRGIPSELLDAIFDPFVQGERSVDGASGGLGIGLTLVRRLVEMHGGSVEARSPGAGLGSEFVVTVPLEGRALPLGTTAGAGNADMNATAAARLKLLVADDNRDGAESLTQLLQLAGHQVRTVYDGAAALDAARAEAPDVALLDIGMPELDGLEVARRLRTVPGCERTLLVAVTGWGQAEDRARSRSAGFDHHLVKPVDLPALHALLASWARATAPAARRLSSGG